MFLDHMNSLCSAHQIILVIVPERDALVWKTSRRIIKRASTRAEGWPVAGV